MKNFKPAVYNFLYRIIKLYWFVFRPKTSGAICLIKNNNEEFLLIRQTYGSGKWTLPGGGIKNGESPEATVVREIMEEVNIEIKDLQLLGSYETSFEYKHDTVFCFGATVKGEDQIVKTDGAEIASAGWFKIEDFPEPRAMALEKTLNEGVCGKG
jgi:mutator protein MutT